MKSFEAIDLESSHQDVLTAKQDKNAVYRFWGAASILTTILIFTQIVASPLIAMSIMSNFQKDSNG